MFAWRKPKPSDDEPLVPHGLIWQATEEPMPPEPKRVDAGPRVSDSPITVRARPSAPPPNIDTFGDAPPKMGAVSDPLPWASMNAKDALKRPPPFWDRNTALKTPPPVPASAAADSKPASLPSPKPNLVALPVRNAKLVQSAARDAVSKPFLAERKQELRAAWSEFMHAIAELCANTRHAYAGWELRKNIRRAREQAQASLAKTLARKPSVAAAPEDNAPSRVQATLTVARNAAVRIERKAVASFANSARSVRGLMPRRIRIRIAAGSQLRSYLSRFQGAQAKSLSMLQQNSRLATSLTMAALSAVLTLGLILMVSRYEQSANAEAPAVTSTPRQGTTAIHWDPVVAKPSLVGSAHSGPTTNHGPVVNTTLKEPAKPTTKTTTVRRVHHNEDEDYVAPDTYVYYGKKR